MNIHFIILILFLSLGLFVFRRAHDKTDIRRYLMFCCVLLILDSGLRNVAVGTDTYAYFLKYENVSQMSWKQVFHRFIDVYINKDGKDAGYDVLQKAMSSLGVSFQLYLVIVACIFFGALYLLLDRFSFSTRDIYIAFLIYLSLFYNFFSITGIRQTISVALGILSFLSLSDNSYSRFFVLVIVAFFIHKSAAVLLLFPVFRLLKNNSFVCVLCVIGFVVFAVYRDYFVSSFRDLAEYEEFVADRPISLMLFLFVLSVICMYSLFKSRNESFQILIRCCLPTFMWIPLLGNDSLFMRLIYYFDILLCAALPLAISNLKGKMVNIITFSLIVLLIIHTIGNNTEYAFFWEEMALDSVYD